MKNLLRIPAYLALLLAWIIAVIAENAFGSRGKASAAIEDFYHRHWR